MAYRGRGAPPARPENALQRADELQHVGQHKQALQVLHDVVTSKKHRTWNKSFEDIMFRLINLAVEQKNRNMAKEALMQYRNMCQQVNINSLEEVIRHYLNKATEKADEARKQAEATTLETVEDLEEDERPEDLMLSYVSGEKSKDRTDRELVTPWFRFLWESYRSVLEILRTNPKLEALYAMAAKQAFKFCEHYKRTAEFRRLCDILRQHLSNMAKYREQRDITAPESLALHLETRFEQLRVACELEMWAEAFRSVEDIQALITLGKRQPKHQVMAAYYSRLTQIFAVSGAHLHHAYAWLKLLSFSRSYNKGLTPADTQMMATAVVLAALSIPPYERALFERTGADDQSAEQDKERALRMASILGFTVDAKRVADYRSIMSRQALLTSITSLNILAMVPPEVRQLWELLTNEFDPLQLCTRLAPLLEGVGAMASPMSTASPLRELSMAQYVAPIKKVAVVRMLRQLGDVYSSMTIPALGALVPFHTFSEVEALVVDAVRHGYLQTRIDYREGTLTFGARDLESDKIRSHLALLAKRLARAAHMIHPDPAPAAEARRLAVVRHCQAHVEGEHKRAIARKRLIEKRKEEQEQLLLEQEKEEERKRQRQAREVEELEEKRRREDAARREKERLERELEEQELEEARRLLEASRARKKGAGLNKDGAPLDKKALMQGVVAERLKEQQDLERRLARQAKAMDHLERARREEEAPYIEEADAARVEEERVAHDAARAAFLERHRATWEADVQEKARLAAMGPDREEYVAAVMARRREVFEALTAARARRLAERRAQRKVEREIRRRQVFVRRSREEVEARIEELQAAAKAAEEEKRRAEEAERQRKLEEGLARQRAREEEIERKLREEKAAVLAGGAAPAPAAAAAGGGGGGAPNKFVPPHLRRQTPAQGAAPPAAAASRGEDGGAGWRDRPAREESAAPWRRGDRDEAPPARPAPAAAGVHRGPLTRGEEGGSAPAPGGVFKPSAAARREEGASADAGAGTASGGAYKPPIRKEGADTEGTGGSGAYRPPARRW